MRARERSPAVIDLDETEIENFISLNNETVILKQHILPSDWYEQKKILMPSSAAIPGYVSYYNTPYWKEPLNCISPDHPAKDITIMGPAQDGKTFMVLEPMIGYIIECNPGNILHLTGNSDLSPDASLRIDAMIDNCKIRGLIKPSIQKLRNNRTGDTAIRKEFLNGIYRVNSITKKNALRQNDIFLLILDDADAARKTDSKVGNIWDTAKGRTKAFEWKTKRVCTSSPEEVETSLILEVFERSDKRLYHIPCPCCNEPIVLESNINIDDQETAGLTWKLDNLGRVDFKTVGYICQKCAGFFDERDKLRWLNDGFWKPSCEPKELYHYGYKKNGLLASPGMTSWYTLASEWLLCNPVGQSRNEPKYQSFLNVMMGEPYERPTIKIESREIQKNIRTYAIGSVPDAQSIKDGNGHIVLLTCACDLGGRYIGDQIKSTYDDARLDWEIVGHCENGTTYSIDHGSIGTFSNAWMKKSEDRERWSYDISKHNNVWQELDKIISKQYQIGGYIFPIQITGIDTGFATHHVWNYIDSRSNQVRIVGIKGDKETKPRVPGMNVKNWKFGQTRSNEYVLEVGHLKDKLASRISLKWDRNGRQPGGFMNFPQPSDGKYGLENYFLHFEAEHRVQDLKKGTFIWQKKGPTVQNHFFDISVYGMALTEVIMYHIFKDIGADVRESSWRDLCAWLLAQWGIPSALPV